MPSSWHAVVHAPFIIHPANADAIQDAGRLSANKQLAGCAVSMELSVPSVLHSDYLAVFNTELKTHYSPLPVVDCK